MAAISRIRKHFWVLVVLMVLALITFILTSNNNGAGSNQRTDSIGKVNGKNIAWSSFTDAENILYKGATGDSYGRRAQLWNYFVEEAIVSEEAQKLGLGVCNEELNELQFSQDDRNLSDVIKTRFSDQRTRRLDRDRLNQIKKLLVGGQLNEDYTKFWAYQQKEIVNSRLKNKMAALVGKAAYTPSWMVDMVGADQGKKADIIYVKVPFSNITDEQAALSDEDYKNYIQAHKAQYWRDEPSRKVGYVIFNIKPTTKDTIDKRNVLAGLATEFEKTTDDSLFVVGQGGQWNSAYLTEKQLPKQVAGELLNAPVGTIVGPFLDGSNFTISKILDRKTIPDSVRSRHILVNAKTQQDYIDASAKIDSLKELIESGGATFASIAGQYNTDITRTKGGDLGYVAPNSMVKPFNDVIFYKADQGKIYKVATEFGVHLVEVTGKKFTNNLTGVKLGTLSKLIDPSDETQGKAEQAANQFARDNSSVKAMKAAAEKDPNLTYKEAPLLLENDYIVGELGANNESKKIIKWAFGKDRKAGEVNPDILLFRAQAGFYYDKAVVVGLVTKVKAGLPTVAALKDQLKPLVLSEKKGSMLASQIKSNDLSAVASQYGLQIDTANNVGFAGGFIPGLGNEPKVVGATFRQAKDVTSAPIVGKGGVFLVKPIRSVASNTPANADFVRKQQDGSFVSQAKSQLINALKKKAKVVDHRSNFF